METLIGNAVVGQSGGPTSAINATLAGVIEGVKSSVHGGQIRKLFGMRNGVEGFCAEDLVDLTEFASVEGNTEKLKYTPASALGSCRKKLPSPGSDPAFYENLLSLFRRYDIRYFFYIGGNDSMDTVAKLTSYLKKTDYEMRVIGVPKTIDNDLVGTDHTPGFGSAAKYIAVTVQEILRDCAVYRIPAVTVVEIMGRDAGWLTAASALGRTVTGLQPDLVYLPERTFDLDAFFADVRAALAKHPNVVVAVSEGIRFADGHYVGEGRQNGMTDVFGHTYLSGTGKVLETAIKEEIGCKVRSVELSLPQRCAAHLASATDLKEAFAVGREAVRFASEGVTGRMVTILREPGEEYRVTYGHSAVGSIANRIRFVNPEFINEKGNHVTDECVRYLLPLINGEAAVQYRAGLPDYITL